MCRKAVKITANPAAVLTRQERVKADGHYQPKIVRPRHRHHLHLPPNRALSPMRRKVLFNKDFHGLHFRAR